MSDFGSVPSGTLRVLASSVNIPGSGSSPTELTANLPGEARVWEVFNGTGADVNIYEGPDTSLDLVCCIPGMASVMVKADRGPVTFSKGTRLSARAAGAGAISTGSLVINLWR